MLKRAILSITSAALMSLLATTTVHAQDEFEQALKALDAQLPGTLINNPYDIKWSTEGSDKRDKVVKSDGAPGGMAYQVTVKKRKKNHLYHTEIPN